MDGNNPVDTLMRLSGAQCVSRALHVVADLGIADALGDTPQPSAALGRSTGTHAETLERVLRLLCGYGIFAIQDGMFAHSPASHPGEPLALGSGDRCQFRRRGLLPHRAREVGSIGIFERP